VMLCSPLQVIGVPPPFKFVWRHVGAV
jgi:hypothetical protein